MFGASLSSRPAWGRGRSPFYRPTGNFALCSIERRHLASVTIAVGLVALLLLVFAYHGGYGVGSWFYSFLVVVCGLAFVIIGPMLLCRYLIFSLQNRTAAVDALSGNLTTRADHSGSHHRHRGRSAHVYACIIIAPEQYLGERLVSPTHISSDLPTYDECVAMEMPSESTGHDCVVQLSPEESSAVQLSDTDAPPPTYTEAMARLNDP